MRKEVTNTPQALVVFEKDIASHICNHDSLSCGVCFIPIKTGIEGIGAYTITPSSAHRVYFKVLLFDGHSVQFATLDDETKIFNFLTGTCNLKINKNKLTRRISKIRKHNLQVNESQVW